MIRFDGVEKIYPGQAQPAVQGLTFEVPEGATCVLVGPSGCGKTTILKMVNRLIEPTAGQIFVAGRSIMDVNPVVLRRGIGYVIQQIGLFPHMTIAENIATVPRLLGWDEARISRRVDELLDLVGMDPTEYRHRYPRQLSGGQAQRVGVARALAADPPVMLMDEPFGAIDPITRERLQDEFLKIQQRIRKTVLFVTHDIDEAVRMGDCICVLRDGRLLQFGTPDEILRRPADEFVGAFLGAARALKRLQLVRVDAVMRRAVAEGVQSLRAGATAAAPVVSVGATLAEALSLMFEHDVSALTVADGQGAPVGMVSLDDIRRVARSVSND